MSLSLMVWLVVWGVYFSLFGDVGLGRFLLRYARSLWGR